MTHQTSWLESTGACDADSVGACDAGDIGACDADDAVLSRFRHLIRLCKSVHLWKCVCSKEVHDEQEKRMCQDLSKQGDAMLRCLQFCKV